MNPSFIFVLVVLLASIAGSVTVLTCIDFLRPPNVRARVDHHHAPATPLKGIARAPARVKTRPLTLRSLAATIRGLRAEGRL